MLSETHALALLIVSMATVTVISYVLFALLGSSSFSRLDRATFSLAPGFLLSFSFMGSWQAGKTRLPGRLSFASRGAWRRAGGAFVRGLKYPAAIGALLLVGYPLIVALSEWEWSFGSAQGYFALSTFIVGVGLVVGLGLAVHDWLTTPREDARRADPVELLRNDRTSAIVSAVITGLTVALLIVPIFVLCVTVSGSLGGMVTGWPGSRTRLELSFDLPIYDRNDMSAPLRLPGWVIGGSLAVGALFTINVLLSRAWTQFLLLRVSLRVAGDLPLRLMGFLAEAQRRQLIRQAGGVYQFRHVRLQERLVTRAAPQEEKVGDEREDLVHRAQRLARRHAATLALAGTAVVAVLASAMVIPRDQAAMVLECGRPSPVESINATPNGITLVGLRADKICFWRRDSAAPFATAALSGGPPESALLALDGRTFLVSAKGRVTVWETGSGKEIRPLSFGAEANSAVLSPDGKTVVSGVRAADDAMVRADGVWNVLSGKKVVTFPEIRGPVDVRYSPNGRSVAVFSRTDPRLFVVSIDDPAAPRLLTLPMDRKTSVGFTPLPSPPTVPRWPRPEEGRRSCGTLRTAPTSPPPARRANRWSSAPTGNIC